MKEHKKLGFRRQKLGMFMMRGVIITYMALQTGS
jgi:hypothetical protein